ncbi:MAG: hypothetical protein E5Y73_11450 [Mesorhizobium sp.]|uniref:hypothetical protein n=1 Tax=Mesorhizobium sp. TaxID=1871066 RepID=UPI00120C51EC|nr:hypothetical protein [Mesorhizobium sp.]TIL94527.1 MAG: hypothetical protein E5Y73_11450 [Mesorhizobium sp.]
MVTILRVLADRADKNGRVNESQYAVASRAGMTERTARDSISVLEKAGMLMRTRRSSGKKGRVADLINLSMGRSFKLSRQAVAALRSVGATGTLMPIAPAGATGTETWVQPAPKRGCNRQEIPVAPMASRGEEELYTSPEVSESRTSGRHWYDRQRLAWRAAVRLDGVDMTLGRFTTEAAAVRAIEGALADIRHTSQAGYTPVLPFHAAEHDELQGKAFMDWMDHGPLARLGTARRRSPAEPTSMKPSPSADFNHLDDERRAKTINADAASKVIKSEREAGE